MYPLNALLNLNVIEVCTCPSLAGKWEMIFPTGRIGPYKREMIFSMSRQRRNKFTNGPIQKKKKRKTNNIESQSGMKKQGRNFQPVEKKKKNVSNLGDNKCKCANEMRLSLFITRFLTNNYWFFHYYWIRFPIFIQLVLFITRIYS